MELTEERLAEIEGTVRWQIEHRKHFPGSKTFGEEWLLELAAEVRRLRAKVEVLEAERESLLDRR